MKGPLFEHKDVEVGTVWEYDPGRSLELRLDYLVMAPAEARELALALLAMAMRMEDQ